MNLKASLLKDKKSTSEKLRIENKQMELRLQQLKLAMVKEKEDRLSNGNKSNWSTGTPGALLNYKPTISAIDSGKKIRLKMLKQETLPSVVRTTSLKSNVLRDVADGEILLPKSGINIELNGSGKNMSNRSCGQCEEIQAAVNCKECAEDYCPKCFAAFHLKGALRKHRSTPISTLNNRVSIPSPLFKAPDFKNVSNSSQSRISSSRNLEKKNKVNILENSTNKEPAENSKENLSPMVNGSLLAEGEYNEEVSNQYFQEAMNAWRNGIDLSTKLPNLQKTLTIEHSTETLSNNQEKNLLADLIQFTPSLTYAEQLLLRKHRNNQLAPVDMKYILDRLAKTNEAELLENQRLLQSNLLLETSLINSNTEKVLKTDQYHVDFDSVNKLLNEAELITGRHSAMSTRNILQSPFKIEEIPSYSERKSNNNQFPEKLEVDEIEQVQENIRSNFSSEIISQKNNGNEEMIRAISDLQRPKSVINRNNFYDKPLSARRKSARQHKGGKLTSEPSVLLNILANFSIYLPDNSNSSSLTQLSSKRPSSADVSLSNNKISYNFYKITPNSWKPAQAWSDELLERKSMVKYEENSLSPIDNEDDEIEEELTKLNLLSSQAKKSAEESLPFSEGMPSNKSSINDKNDRNLLSDVDGDYYDDESEKNEIFGQMDTLERELTVLSKQEQAIQQNNYDEMLIDSLDINNDNICLNSMDSDKFCFEDSLDFQQRYSNNSNVIHEHCNGGDDEEMQVECSSRFDDYEDVYKLN